MPTEDYDMLSNLRDYLEDIEYAVENTSLPNSAEVELDYDEICWILDQIYFTKRHENDPPVESGEGD